MNEKADPMLGRVLDGRYRIERRIARGGMAIVYEATDLRLDRVVAVKVMHENLAHDQTFVQRFEREARSAAKLSNPNAMSVFDQGEDNGTLFLVMEYVPGVTLRDVIRREAPLPASTALRIIESVLSALQAAHSIGIIHRDIKPENVLLPTGDLQRLDTARIKVADFGLARAINAETQHTATGGVIIGTVSYLAPEMLVNAATDARVDVYATGVLLYELLTGQKPHQADTPIQVAYKHVHEDIAKPSASVLGIPPYLDALVARATTRDPDQRPADAGVLLHHVQRVRQAIDSGVLDDPDLTADLVPNARSLEEDTAAAGIPGWPVDPDYGVEMTAQLGPAFTPVTPPAKRPSVPNRRRRLAVFLTLLLLLLGAVGASSWYFLEGRYTHVPGVANLPQATALEHLKADGLHGVADQRAYSLDVAKGSVISSDPTADARVLKGSTVRLVISLGKPVVPQLSGLTLTAAKAKLTAVNIAFGGSSTICRDAVKAGLVIQSTPKAGVSLERLDKPVSLIVSSGLCPVTIPDLTNQSLADAMKSAKALELKLVKGSTAFSDTVPQGAVISQTPKPGTQGHHRDTIRVVLSKGPDLAMIPDVKDLSWDDAVATLKAAGFNATAGNTKAQAAELFFPTISGAKHTDPRAGEKARRGSTIAIYF